MRCRQVIKLINYHINSLFKRDFTKSANCDVDPLIKSSEGMWIKTALDDYLDYEKVIKAPEHFTENVMNAVSNISLLHSVASTNILKFTNIIAIKRLGISMILTSIIMLLCMSLPIGQYSVNEYIYDSAKFFYVRDSYQVTDTLYQVNANIQDFLSIINNSIKKFKEV